MHGLYQTSAFSRSQTLYLVSWPWILERWLHMGRSSPSTSFILWNFSEFGVWTITTRSKVALLDSRSELDMQDYSCAWLASPPGVMNRGLPSWIRLLAFHWCIPRIGSPSSRPSSCAFHSDARWEAQTRHVSASRLLFLLSLSVCCLAHVT